VHLIQIDPVGAQPAQGVLDRPADVAARSACAPVDAVVLAEASDVTAELGRDQNVVPPALKDLAEALLGVAIRVRRVKQIDAVIEGGMHHGPALLEIELQTEVVGAEADHGNGETGGSKTA
jgi:hypothetical protein